MRVLAVLALVASLLPTAARGDDSRLQELIAAVRHAPVEESPLTLADVPWDRYFRWGEHNQDELVWLSQAVNRALLGLTERFHVHTIKQLPRDDPGVRRLLLINAKAKLAGQNPDEARQILRDLLDRNRPDTSKELAEALYLYALAERGAAMEKNPRAPTVEIRDRMTEFIRQAEPYALTAAGVELAATPEEAAEQEWRRTLLALRAYMNDRQEWGPVLALEFARALDMSRVGPEDLYLTVRAFQVVNRLLGLMPSIHSADALWISPWGTMYLGLFSCRVQEFGRAEDYFREGQALIDTIAAARVSVDDWRIPNLKDRAVLRHPDTLYTSEQSAPAASGNLLAKWTYLMEAQERFGDLRPGERGWDNPQGMAIAANGLPTAVGYETLYDEVSADSATWKTELAMRGRGMGTAFRTTPVHVAKRSYVWKTADGKVVRRDFGIYGERMSVGPDLSSLRRSGSWSEALENTRSDVQVATDEQKALVNLPAAPEIARTVCRVRAATFRRSQQDNTTFVIGLASDSPKDAWFKESTAEFTLLDAQKYPVAASRANAWLGENQRHHLANGGDMYVAVINTAGVPPGRYGWQVSLKAGGRVLKSYLSGDSEQVLIRAYEARELQISDAQFQTSEEVPDAEGKTALEYVPNPFQRVFVRDSADRDGAPDSVAAGNRRREPAQFSFLVEVYNLHATKQTGASYEAHYAVLSRSTFDQQVRPLLDRPQEKPPALAGLASGAVVQDVSGNRFCQTVEVGSFSVPSHEAPATGGGTVKVAEQNIDYGERHLAVTVEVGALSAGAYVLAMEVRDRADGASALQFVPFVVRSY